MDIIEKLSIVILPILVAALLTSVIRRKHKDKERFNLACDAINFAFNSELATLKNPSLDNPIDPYILLVAGFDKHRTAVIEFRRFLGYVCQRKFDRTWYNYYSYDNTGKAKTDYLLKYSSGWTRKPVYECRELFA